MNFSKVSGCGPKGLWETPPKSYIKIAVSDIDSLKTICVQMQGALYLIDTNINCEKIGINRYV